MKDRLPAFLLFLGVAALSSMLAACQADAPWRPTVKAVDPAEGMIVKNVQFSGVFVPNRTVNISAQVSGQATFVGADVGDRVKKGQLLVKIDTRELDAQLKEAEARLQGAVDQAAQAKIGVETARLTLALAERAYNRTKTLLENEIITKSRLDDAQTKLDLAKEAIDNASQQYKTVSGSGVAQAEAQINAIKVLISNSAIISPLNGIVATRSINPGELTTLTIPLMTIVDTARLKLEGNLWQEDIAHLSLGDPVSISVDAFPGRQYSGRIEQVGPVAAATGQYFPVVVSLANDGRLFAGMTAKAAVTLRGAQSVIVPLSAVDTEEHGQPFVFVIKGEEVHKRAVSLGMSNNTDVQVLSGLAIGQTVADSDVQSLQNGMHIDAARHGTRETRSTRNGCRGTYTSPSPELHLGAIGFPWGR